MLAFLNPYEWVNPLVRRQLQPGPEAGYLSATARQQETGSHSGRNDSATAVLFLPEWQTSAFLSLPAG
jgi:hypothetical protein